MDSVMQMQSDREQRILARRKRIQERLQALREGEMAGPEKLGETEHTGPGRQQTLESVRKVMALRTVAEESVSVIRLTGDHRENSRRIAEEASKQELRAKLLAEAEASARQNAAVAMKWADLFTIEVPQDLYEEIKSQMAACDSIITSKNSLIADIKRELKRKDDEFVKVLKQQAEDIDTLLETMAEKLAQVSKACRTELEEIENAYMHERQTLLDANGREVKQLFDKRSNMEQEFMEKYLSLVAGYQQQLFDLQVTDAEDYSTLKIRLETDIQNLEQHLEVMRATYQLNTEKLEYNYRVLVERDHENTDTINQQKRKISRQRDILSNLKARYAESDKKYQEENMKLTSEYKRITEQFKDLQTKFKHFELVDTKKYTDIWRMKEEEVAELAKKVMAADKILHEQQMGWDWQPPLEEVLISPYSPETVTAKEQHAEKADDEEDEVDEAAAAKQAGLDEVRRHRESPKFKEAMKLITEEGSFLLEPKFRKSVSELPPDERGSVLADALLEALGVADGLGFEALMDALAPGSDIELRAKGMSTGTQDKRAVDDDSPLLLVHPDDVVKRLKAFVEAENASVQGGGKKSKAVGQTRPGISRRVLEREREFWKKCSNVVDDKGRRIWGALEANLEKYYKLLQEREKGLRLVEPLGQQNVELRALLNQYLSSQINSELQIPPTQLI